MPALLIGLIRTVVPFVVGLVVALAAKLGLGDLVDADGLTEALTVLVGALYYQLAKWLEQRDPKWGWLIGYATAPTYPTLDEAKAGLAPVPASEAVPRSEVVAQLSPTGLPVTVAGPASPLPDGTAVAVLPVRT